MLVLIDVSSMKTRCCGSSTSPARIAIATSCYIGSGLFKGEQGFF